MQDFIMTLRMIEAPDAEAARDEVFQFGKESFILNWEVIRVEPERWSASEIKKNELDYPEWVRPRWSVTVAFTVESEDDLDFALDVTGMISETFVWSIDKTPEGGTEPDLWKEMSSGDQGAIKYGINLAKETLTAALTSNGPLPDIGNHLAEMELTITELRNQLEEQA